MTDKEVWKNIGYKSKTREYYISNKGRLASYNPKTKSKKIRTSLDTGEGSTPRAGIDFIDENGNTKHTSIYPALEVVKHFTKYNKNDIVPSDIIFKDGDIYNASVNNLELKDEALASNKEDAKSASIANTKDSNKHKNEEWHWVKGYEGYYEISNLGFIRKVSYSKFDKSKKIVTPLTPLNKNGHKYISLIKDGKIKDYPIYKLVEQAFDKPDESQSKYKKESKPISRLKIKKPKHKKIARSTSSQGQEIDFSGFENFIKAFQDDNDDDDFASGKLTIYSSEPDDESTSNSEDAPEAEKDTHEVYDKDIKKLSKLCKRIKSASYQQVNAAKDIKKSILPYETINTTLLALIVILAIIKIFM